MQKQQFISIDLYWFWLAAMEQKIVSDCAENRKPKSEKQVGRKWFESRASLYAAGTLLNIVSHVSLCLHRAVN